MVARDLLRAAGRGVRSRIPGVEAAIGRVPGVEVGRVEGHPYVRAGTGRPLVVVPGLNDPLHRVTDSWWYALGMAAFCRRFPGRATYVVSRPPGLGPTDDARGMARGYARVLEAIADAADRNGGATDHRGGGRNGGPAGDRPDGGRAGDGRPDGGRAGDGRPDVMGVSMGGFVVAHLAADHPDLVDRAVLALAADRVSPRGRPLLERWKRLAREGRWLPVYLEAVDVVAGGTRGRFLRAAARGYDLVRSPSHPEDFVRTVRSTLAHDATDRLGAVDRPTLVVGGEGDPFFSVGAFRRTARALPDGRLALLSGASHRAPLEAPDAFLGPIREFLTASG